MVESDHLTQSELLVEGRLAQEPRHWQDRSQTGHVCDCLVAAELADLDRILKQDLEAACLVRRVRLGCSVSYCHDHECWFHARPAPNDC